MAKTQIDWSCVWMQFDKWVSQLFSVGCEKRALVSYLVIARKSLTCQKIQELVEAQLDGPLFTPEQNQLCKNIDFLSKSQCALPGYDLKDFISEEGRDLYERWLAAHKGHGAEDDGKSLYFCGEAVNEMTRERLIEVIKLQAQEICDKRRQGHDS